MTQFAFPIEEFSLRLEKIRAKMSAKGIDALVVSRPENIFFVSGFRAAHVAMRTAELPIVVIPKSGTPILMTRALEAAAAQRQWTTPRLYKDYEDPYALFAQVAAEFGAGSGRIGIEERVVRVSQHKRLRAAVPGAELIDVSGMVESVAALPSPAETACIERAARVTELGLHAGFAGLAEGVYPYDLVAKIHGAMYGAGQSDFDRSLVAVWSGPNGGRMHDTLTTEQVAKGDIVTVEVMGVDTHYRAGGQGCAYIGDEPPKAYKEAYDLIARMHDAARGAVRAGVTAGSVFDAANAVYKAAKGVDYYRRCGGSMGLTQFTVDLVKGRGDVLTPGLALLIQTLVDDPVLLTYASTILVTPGGYREITRPLSGGLRCVR
ncbi:MAG: aminopeptidase P family protein [Alphaproteobacteria bacterium]|nr:aminopeptidase P family protein [Alphaproteobacteria bacterium]